MGRRNRSPEEQERRAKIRELLQMSNVSSMEDIQNLFKETIAEFMEDGLDAELPEELGYSKYDYKNKDTDNSRNGHSTKTLRTSFGNVGVSVPRDRKGEFEPRLLKKNKTSISHDVEEKILSMYAKWMTTGDIEAHIRDIYGLEVSDTTVSRITDRILPVAKELQQRPQESIYAVVFLDAIRPAHDIRADVPFRQTRFDLHDWQWHPNQISQRSPSIVSVLDNRVKQLLFGLFFFSIPASGRWWNMKNRRTGRRGDGRNSSGVGRRATPTARTQCTQPKAPAIGGGLGHGPALH